jgi:hypothetical protein
MAAMVAASIPSAGEGNVEVIDDQLRHGDTIQNLQNSHDDRERTQHEAYGYFHFMA